MQKSIYDYLVMSDNDMFKHLLEISNQHCKTTISDNENYIYGKNDGSKVCLVAHIDTVCRNEFKVLTVKKGIIKNENGILGADDRAGCFAIEMLLETVKTPFDILFTNYEEAGGVGVDIFCDDIKNIPDYKVFIELDRQGHNEYVTYHSFDKQFHQWAKSFKLKESFGSFSDISILTDEYDIASLNLGIGYTGQHTSKEQLNIDHLKQAIKTAIKMINRPPSKNYKPKQERVFKSYNTIWDKHNTWDRKPKTKPIIHYDQVEMSCPHCGADLADNEIDGLFCFTCGRSLYDECEYNSYY